MLRVRKLTAVAAMVASTDGSVTVDDQDSDFLRLPGELRNRIYDMALIADHQPITAEPWTLYDKSGHLNGLQPALARCCRSLRAEALPVFYSKNAFQLHVWPAKGRANASRWLRAIGAPNRAHVGSVYISRPSSGTRPPVTTAKVFHFVQQKERGENGCAALLTNLTAKWKESGQLVQIGEGRWFAMKIEWLNIGG